MVQVILPLVSDREISVRLAAMRALGELANKGDQSVIVALVLQMKGESDLVSKQAAEEVLPIVAKGDDQTIELFCKVLLEEEEEGSLQALRTLGQIAEHG